MSNIKLNQMKKTLTKHECLICGDVRSEVQQFMPCKRCKENFLSDAVLLVEVIGKEEKQEATGRVMVIRDIAFEQVFNQTIPKERVIKVEIGILQRMEDQIKGAKYE